MKTISLKDFLLTGTFGQVAIGMTKDEMIACLGQPDGIYHYFTETSSLFYNGFEFFYWTDSKQLFGIQNDNLAYLLTNKPIVTLTESILIDTSFFLFRQALTYENLTRHLKTARIDFHTSDKGDYDELKLLSSVTLDFENSATYLAPDLARSNFRLNGIRYYCYD